MATSFPDDDLPPSGAPSPPQTPDDLSGGMDHVRAGLRAPIPDAVDEAELRRVEIEDMTVVQVMNEAIHIKRVMRNYRCEPAWGAIRRRLVEMELVLSDRVDRGVHTVLDVHRLGEVRSHLGRRSRKA
jgi:hypothetical protein